MNIDVRTIDGIRITRYRNSDVSVKNLETGKSDYLKSCKWPTFRLVDYGKLVLGLDKQENTCHNKV
jgi:hypothetical protein